MLQQPEIPSPLSDLEAYLPDEIVRKSTLVGETHRDLSPQGVAFTFPGMAASAWRKRELLRQLVEQRKDWRIARPHPLVDLFVSVDEKYRLMTVSGWRAEEPSTEFNMMTWSKPKAGFLARAIDENRSLLSELSLPYTTGLIADAPLLALLLVRRERDIVRANLVVPVDMKHVGAYCELVCVDRRLVVEVNVGDTGFAAGDDDAGGDLDLGISSK